MAELSGNQIERFKNALLAAFDRAELVQLVRTGLEENLEAIAGAGKLDTVAYDLVLWAGRNDRLDDLLAAAQAARPKNAQFAALAAELGAGKAGDAAQAQPGAQLPGLPGGVSIGEIKESNVSFGGTQTITQIHTGGGAYIAGNVDTGGGDFVGRDQATSSSDASGGSEKVFFKLAGERCPACPAGGGERGHGAGDGPAGRGGQRRQVRRRAHGGAGAGAGGAGAAGYGCGGRGVWRSGGAGRGGPADARGAGGVGRVVSEGRAPNLRRRAAGENWRMP